jgi:ABC-2 type transport system ATP-binding protein
MSEFYDIPRKEIEAKILHYAEIFGLKGKLDILLPNMSSGQRKRIMIIQALINDPDVLIMDEPTENLDPDNRETFYKVLDELKTKGTTMLISTHNLIELEEHCDHVIIIAKGEIKYQGLVEKRHGALREIFNTYREKEEI